MRKGIRRMLLETIQEAVDQVYFLEEDTIQIAGWLMDSVLRQEMLPLVQTCIEEQRIMEDRCNLSSSECDEEGEVESVID